MCFIWENRRFATDYFYYLSQISQGKHSWILARYIWGSEHIPPSLIGWTYVLVGRITSSFQVTPIIAYQIYLALATFLYILLPLIYLRQIFPRGIGIQSIALFFFIFSNEFPKVVMQSGSLAVNYQKNWYNFGEPFVRLDPGPHHLLTHVLMFCIFLLFICFWKEKSRKRILLGIPLFVCTIALVTIQPIQLVLVIISVALGYVVTQFRSFSLPEKHQIESFLVGFAPIILVSAITLPAIIYMNKQVNIFPYNLGRIWENTLQVHYGILGFFKLHGPVSVLGVLGIPWFFKKRNIPVALLGVYTTVAFTLFFSPIPHAMGALNQRFLSVLPILFFSASATNGVFLFSSQFIRFKHLIRVGIFGCLSILSLVSLPQQFHLKMTTNPSNYFYYVPQTIYRAVVELEKISSPKDVILAFPPFEKIVSGLTGHRSYFVNDQITPDYNKKGYLAYLFYENKMTVEEMRNFLTSNTIKYIFIQKGAPMIPPQYLIKKYENEVMRIFQVSEE